MKLVTSIQAIQRNHMKAPFPQAALLWLLLRSGHCALSS